MTADRSLALPLICLSAGAFAVYLVARLLTRRHEVLAVLTASIFGLALLTQLSPAASASVSWLGIAPTGVELQPDPGAEVLSAIALGLGMLVALYSGRYLALDRRYETFYPLLLLLTTGLVGMVWAADLFTIYLFCELMSIAAYVLVAFRRQTDTAIEAGFKYLVLGSVGTITFLLGISFIFRETGSLVLPNPTADAVWTRAGLACFLVGLGIKSAIVPLHTWLPDAHGRAPSSVSAMLSGVVIQAAFYTLVRVSLGVGMPAEQLGMALIVASLINMTVGNGMALMQKNTKRLLAYSSIAQLGYAMLSMGIGLRYGLPAALQAGFFMILAHAVLKGLAFLCKGVCHFYHGTTTVEQLRGTSTRLPLVAVTFGLALVGLAGIPPLAGFVGKWFVLMGVLQAGNTLGILALVAFLLNSLVALGYYLPLLSVLFARLPAPSAQPDPQAVTGLASAQLGSVTGTANPVSPPPVVLGSARARLSPWMGCPLIILAGLALAIGLYPAPWLAWMADVGAQLLAFGR